MAGCVCKICKGDYDCLRKKVISNSAAWYSEYFDLKAFVSCKWFTELSCRIARYSAANCLVLMHKFYYSCMWAQPIQLWQCLLGKWEWLLVCLLCPWVAWLVVVGISPFPLAGQPTVASCTGSGLWNAVGDSLGHDLAIGHLIGESILLSVPRSKNQSCSQSLDRRIALALGRSIGESISFLVTQSETRSCSQLRDRESANRSRALSQSAYSKHSLITRLSHDGGGGTSPARRNLACVIELEG